MPRTEQPEAEAVAKGAQLLDKILPGWHNYINLQKLNMSHGQLCMMGQLFGSDVESKLAREMYPDEMEQARQTINRIPNYGDAEGYAKALCFRDKHGRTLVTNLMRKNNITDDEEYQVLNHVCLGHDNKCLWADEIATRRANDLTKTETPTVNPV